MVREKYKQIKVIATGQHNLGYLDFINRRWSTVQRVVLGRGDSDSFRTAPSSVRDGEFMPRSASGIYKIELTSRGEPKLDGRTIRLPHTGRGFKVFNDSGK